MKRLLTPLLAGLLASGCGQLGLDGVPPLDVAAHAAPGDLVAAVHAPPADTGEEMVVDGRLWVPWGTQLEMNAASLRPVGSTHGVTVYARAWDRAPFDAVFAGSGSGWWQAYAPVIGRTGSTGVTPEQPVPDRPAPPAH